MKRDLTEGRGYAFRSEKEIDGGHALRFTVPGRKDTDYWLSLYVTPKQIITVEIAGPHAEMEKELPRLEPFLARLVRPK